MRTFYEADIRKRVKVLTFVLAGWGVIVALRLVQVQVFGHARAKAAVLRQAQNVVKVEPRRGNILDRNGEILACSLPSPSVVIRPVDKETPADASKEAHRAPERARPLGDRGRLRPRPAPGRRHLHLREEEDPRGGRRPGHGPEAPRRRARGRDAAVLPSRSPRRPCPRRGEPQRRPPGRRRAALQRRPEGRRRPADQLPGRRRPAITRPRSSSRPSPAKTSS